MLEGSPSYYKYGVKFVKKWDLISDFTSSFIQEIKAGQMFFLGSPSHRRHYCNDRYNSLRTLGFLNVAKSLDQERLSWMAKLESTTDTEHVVNSIYGPYTPGGSSEFFYYGGRIDLILPPL